MKKIIVSLFMVVMFSFPALAQAEKYTCPMHPHYIADRPGTCPICGMNLVALEESQPEQAIPNQKEGSVKNVRKAVTISPETVQSTGVRTEAAEMASFGTLVRSYGDVTENVRLQYEISSRVEGWIETLKINANGDSVKKGNLLFTLYSPVLISAQQDLISAMQTGIKGRISSSETRLSSLGMQKQAVSLLKKKRKVFHQVPFYAEFDGLVSEIHIREGSYLKPGTKLIVMQNYNTVWVDVSIAEKDIPYITGSTKVTVALPMLGIRNMPAQIDYIYPTIDRATRTGRVRLVLNNPEGALKPGAYVDVEFETGVKKRLSIPSDAILKSKDGDFVVLNLGDGRFQPQKVLLGLMYRGRTEVLEGISENDEVVVSGQFLIDSESALRESFRKMKRMQMPLALLDIDDDQLAMLNHLVDAALYMQENLVTGEEPHPNMIMPALKLGDHLIPVFRGTKLQFVIEDAEAALKKAQKSVTESQWQESLSDLVVALKPWLLEGRPQFYKSKNLSLYTAHGINKYWLQKNGPAANPYGQGHDQLIEWPEKVNAQEPEINESPAGGAHAQH